MGWDSLTNGPIAPIIFFDTVKKRRNIMADIYPYLVFENAKEAMAYYAEQFDADIVARRPLDVYKRQNTKTSWFRLTDPSKQNWPSTRRWQRPNVTAPTLIY